MHFAIFSIALSFATLAIPLPSSAQQSKMRFESVGNGGNCAGCGWILADGEITADTPLDFDNFIRTLGHSGGTLVLNSPGGNLVGGIELGQKIRKAGLSTEIGHSVKTEGGWYEIRPGICASACAYAFVGGKTRSVDQMFATSNRETFSSRFGVHRFFRKDALNNPDAKRYAARDLDQEQQLTSLIAVYLTSMGVDATLLGLAAEADANSMRWLSKSEMESLRIVYDPSIFSPWAVEAYQNGAVAFTQSQDKTTTISLFCNKRKEIFVLINAPDLKPDSAKQIKNCPIGQENIAFGVKFPPENLYQGPNVNNRPTLMIKLQSSPLGTNEDISFDVPRYCTVFFSTSKRRMPEAVRLALRNCL